MPVDADGPDYTTRQYTHQYCMGTPNLAYSQDRHLIVDTLRTLSVTQKPLYLEDSPPGVAYGPHYNGPYMSSNNGWTQLNPYVTYWANSQPACAWTFEAPADVPSIVAGVTYTDLESPGDFLVFVDVTDSSPQWLVGPAASNVNHPPALLRVTGNGTAPAVQISRPAGYAKKTKLLVYFLLDNDVQFEGWGIFVLPVSFSCRHDVITNLTEPSNFFHGGAGYTPQSGSIRCLWLVDVTGVRGARSDGIAFQLHGAALAAQDSLTVYDGDSRGAPVLRRFAGASAAVNVTTSRTRLLVEYTSTLDSGMRFNASYVRLVCPACVNGQCINGTCACNASFAGELCNVPTAKAALVATNWTCGLENYGTGNGCDCGCGMHDPDCEVPEPAGGWCAGGNNTYHDGTCAHCPLARPSWPVNAQNGYPSSGPTANNVLWVSPRGVDVVQCLASPCDNGYNWNNPFKTLAKALTYAQSSLAGTPSYNSYKIVLLPGRYTGISNRRLLYQDSANANLFLTVMGLSGPAYTIVDAERQGWILYMSTKAAGTSLITGLTFANARYLTRSPRKLTTTTAAGSPAGGAIQCGEWLVSPSQETAGCNNVAVTNCRFVDNEVVWNDASVMGAAGTPLFDFGSLGGGDINAALGGGAINLALGKNVTISDSLFTGNRASLTIGGSTALADGLSNSTARKIHGGAIAIYDVTDTVTIRSSAFRGGRAGFYGGAAYVLFQRSQGSGTTVRVENVTVDGNYAVSAGAGVMVQGAGLVSVSNSAFSNNVGLSTSYPDTTAGGAGLWVGAGIASLSVSTPSSVTVENSSFIGNRYSPSYPQVDAGGAGFLASSLSYVALRNLTFVSNFVENGKGGGALIVNVTELAIDGSAFVQNYQGGGTELGGGGLALVSVRRATVRDTRFAKNAGDEGGGMWLGTRTPAIRTSHQADMIGCTWSDNVARVGMGGGLYVDAIALPFVATVDSSMLSGNFAGVSGGGIGLSGPASPYFDFNATTVAVRRTRVTGNTALASGGGLSASNLLYLELSQSTEISGNTATLYGGGVALDGGRVCTAVFNQSACTGLQATLDLVNISSNSGKSGGGLSLTSTDLRVAMTNCNVSSNRAAELGGGVYVVDIGAFALSASSLASNAATGSGGGVYVSSTSPITMLMPSVSFVANTAKEDGGGLFLSGSASVLLTYGQLANNVATANGGLVYVKQTSAITINGLTISGNTADNGGTVYLEQFASALVEDCTFTGSVATTRGGVLYSQQRAKVTFTRVTANSNKATSGAVIYASLLAGATVKLQNCSFKTNEASGPGGVVYFTGSGTFTASYFVAKQNKGARAAVGFFDWFTAGVFSQCDIDSNTATLSDGGAFVVEQSASLSITGCNVTRNTANANGGAILVPTGQAPSLFLTNVQATGNTAGRGGGALAIGSNCNAQIVATNLSRNAAKFGGSVFLTGATVTFDSVPMDNCLANNNGGAVYAESSTLTFVDVSLTHNQASSGGACYLEACTATFTRCDMSSNTGTNLGGSLFTDKETWIEIYDSKIRKNLAYSDGGGIYGGLYTLFTVRRCDISDNEALRDGGGIFLNINLLDVADGSFARCKANRHGGAIYAFASEAYLDTMDLSGGLANAGSGGSIYSEGTNLIATKVNMSNSVSNLGAGGSVAAQSTNLNLYNCTLTGSKARLTGGSISARDVLGDFLGTTLDGSTAGGDGGCMYIDTIFSWTMTMVEGSMRGCTSGGRGGAFFISHTATTMTGVVLSGTADGNGGALALLTVPKVTIVSSVLRGSKSTRGNGGAIWSDGAPLTLRNVDLSRSSAGGGSGGALYFTGAAADVMNCDLSESSASSKGGAAYVRNGTANFTSVQMQRSSAGEGGGALGVEGVDTNPGRCGVTLRGVNAAASIARAGPGGSVSVFKCNFTATDVDMRGSQAGGLTGAGGALQATGARVEVRLCNLTDARADGNGGAASLEDSQFVLEDLPLDRGASLRGAGGALYVSGGSGRVARLSMRSASAGGSGGAVAAVGSTLSIANCDLTGATAGGGGGALYSKDSRLSIADSPMPAAKATGGSGGAILIDSGVVTLSSIDMGGAQATGSPGAGGAVRASSATVTIRGCNLADAHGAGNGGVISTEGATLTVERTAMDRGLSSGGAGGCLHLVGGSASFVDSTLVNCSAPAGEGGAVRAVSSVVTIRNCQLAAARSSGNGGVISADGTTLTVERVAMDRGLSSAGAGGCLYLSGGSASVSDCTLKNCSAPAGEGGAVRAVSSVLAIRRCNVADARSLGNGGVISADGTTLTVEHNAMDRGASGGGSGGCLFLTGGSASLLNCTLRACSAVGGEGGAVRAVSSSLSIRSCDLADARSKGNGGVLSTEGTTLTAAATAMDRGFSAAGAGGCLYLSGGSASVTDCTLQACAALGGDGGAIRALSAPVKILNCNLVDAQSKTNGGVISASRVTLFVGRSALDRGSSSAGSGGCVYLSGGSAAFVDSSLEGCTAGGGDGGAVAATGVRGTEGQAATFERCSLAAAAAGGSGGAVMAAQSSVSFTSCSLARSRAGGSGGALQASQSSVALRDTPVAQSSASVAGGCIYVAETDLLMDSIAADRCSAASGGGIFVDGGKANISRVSLREDRATNGDGGALYASSSDVVLEGSTVELCSATGGGGGLYLSDTSIRIVNGTISNNNATGDGGGVRASGASSVQGVCLLRSVSNSGNSASVSASGSTAGRRHTLSLPDARGRVLLQSNNISDITPLTKLKTVRLEAVLLLSNAAGGDGGGFFASGPLAAELVGVSIANSAASGRGGGIYVTAQAFAMTASTMTANSAAVGGAAYMDMSSTTGAPMDCSAVTLDATTVKGNAAAKGSAFVVKDADPSRCAAFADPTAFAGNGDGGLGSSFVAGPGAITVSVVTNETARVSGEILAFFVVLTDSFGTKVVDAPTLIALAPVDADNVTLRGTLTATTANGETQISAQIFGQPGAESLVKFTAEIPYKPFTIKVPVLLRQCNKGEVQLPNTRVCTVCPAGTFSLLESGFKDQNCRTCPDGAVCPGGAAVYPTRGYQRSPYDYDIMIPCQNEACLGGPEDLCAPGHSGPLCTICTDGYGRRDKYACAACPNKGVNGTLLFITCLIAVGVVAVLVAFNLRSLRPNATKRPSRLTTITKILFSYIQLLSVARDFNLRWPPELRSLFTIQTVVASPADMIISFECFMESRVSRSAFVSRVFGYCLLPAIAVGAPALVFGIAYLAYRFSDHPSVPEPMRNLLRRISQGRLSLAPSTRATPKMEAKEPEADEKEEEEEPFPVRVVLERPASVRELPVLKPAPSGAAAAAMAQAFPLDMPLYERLTGQPVVRLVAEGGEGGSSARSESEEPPLVVLGPELHDLAALAPDEPAAREAALSAGVSRASSAPSAKGLTASLLEPRRADSRASRASHVHGAGTAIAEADEPRVSRGGLAPPRAARPDESRGGTSAPASFVDSSRAKAAGSVADSTLRGTHSIRGTRFGSLSTEGQARPVRIGSLDASTVDRSARGPGPTSAPTVAPTRRAVRRMGSGSTYSADAKTEAAAGRRVLYRTASSEYAESVAMQEVEREGEQGHGAYLYDLFILSSVVSLFLVHPILSRQVFMLFACTPIGRYAQLDQDMRMRCWGSEHVLWSATLGLAAVVCFVLGIPFALAATLWSHRRDLSYRRVLLRYGFVLRGYRRRRYYWEVVVVVRKLAFVFVASVFSARPVVQGLLGTGLLVVAAVANIVMRPYSLELLNILDSVALLASALTLYAGLFYFSQEVSNTDSTVMTIILIALNFVFLVFWVICLLYELMKRAQQQFPKLQVLQMADALGKRISSLAYVRDWLANADEGGEIEVGPGSRKASLAWAEPRRGPSTLAAESVTGDADGHSTKREGDEEEEAEERAAEEAEATEGEGEGGEEELEAEEAEDAEDHLDGPPSAAPSAAWAAPAPRPPPGPEAAAAPGALESVRSDADPDAVRVIRRLEA